MNLHIRGVGFEVCDELREHIERRLGFALRKFASRVAQVTVRIRDVNGPRGGLDKRCSVAVALDPRGVVHVEDFGRDPFALAALAAKRAGRAVQRALARSRPARAYA